MKEKKSEDDVDDEDKRDDGDRKWHSNCDDDDVDDDIDDDDEQDDADGRATMTAKIMSRRSTVALPADHLHADRASAMSSRVRTT